MTKQETIQVLQSIEDRAIDFPNMTECDWVAIAAAKRHLTEEPVSEDLGDYAKEVLSWEDSHEDWDRLIIRRTAHHFAEWQKQQLMKDAIEYTILDQNELSTEVATFPPNQGLGKIREGDSVKIIIVKEN